MQWHIADVKHRVEIYAQLDTPKRVPYFTCAEIDVTGVQFNYEDGMPCYSAAGIQVYGHRVMFNGRSVAGKPVGFFLRFTDHPWLDNMRRDIEDSYKIERPDYDTASTDPLAPAA